MAEQNFEDNDPSVYSSHVLYITKHDANCTNLVTRLEGLELEEVVFVQDVMNLTQRPPWLRGVPTLHIKSPSKILTGSRDILAYASSWQNPDLDKVLTSNLNLNSSGGSMLGGSAFDDSMFSIEGDPTTISTSTDERNKPKGERATRKAAMAAATNSAVEQFQNARSEMDRRFQATMQPGRTPPARNMMEAPRQVTVPQQRRGFDEW
jgi:hypothetical protein